MKNDIKIILKSLNLLDFQVKKKLFYIFCVFFAISLVDLLILFLFGAIGRLLFALIENDGPSSASVEILNQSLIINYDGLNFFMILLATCVVLTFRILFALYFSSRSFKYLLKVGDEICKIILQSYLNYEIKGHLNKTREQNLFIISTGPSNLTVGLLGNLLLVIADLILIVLITICLLFVDVLLSFIAISLVFSLFCYITFKIGNPLRKESYEEIILSNELDSKIAESLNISRQISMTGIGSEFAIEIIKSRSRISEIRANHLLSSFKIKYLVESFILVLLLASSFIAISLYDGPKASSNAAIFIFALYRIVGAYSRLQSSFLSLRSQISIAPDLITLLDEVKNSKSICNSMCERNTFNLDFDPEIKIESMSFSYLFNGELDDLSGINVYIKPYSLVCIFGPSGSGKSTLLNLISGVLTPTFGTITIGGMSPNCAIRHFPRQISFFSQSTSLIKGTLYENITMNLKSTLDSVNSTELELVKKILKSSQLDISKWDLFNTYIDWNGSDLSGGEKQRIGLARALFNAKKILIMDEPTSSLDFKSEEKINEYIHSRSDITRVIVTHNPNLIKLADTILVMDSGKIVKVGNYTEISDLIENSN